MQGDDSPTSRLPLATNFTARLGDVTGFEQPDPEALETLLCAVVSRACDAWPTIGGSHEAFIVFLAERVRTMTSGVELRDLLDQLAVEDLWLAHASVTRQPGAFEAFDNLMRGVAAGALASLRLNEPERVEFLQQMRESLLVGVEDRPAKLAQYTGRGRLRSWLWVVLARSGRRFKKRAQREEPLEDAAAATLALDSGDPELEYIKTQSLNQFRAAFRAAVGSLRERDRDFLRRWLVEGSTIEEVATSYGIHRTTAVRWLHKIRRGLLKSTRLKLGLRLGVGDEELESLINVIQSRLDVSFTDLLLVEEVTGEDSGEKEETV